MSGRASTAIDPDDGNPRLRAKARQGLSSLLDRLRSIADEGRRRGEVRADVDSANLATLIANTLEGNIMVSRLQKKDEPRDLAIRHLEEYLETRVRTQKSRRSTVQLSGGQFEIVALDGMPLSYHDPERSTQKADHILLPPAGRVEAIIVGPPSGADATLSTRCVDTGPDGDANPAMVIAEVGAPGDHSPIRTVVDSVGPPAHDEVGKTLVRELEAGKPDFTVTFTEDKNGFYINGKKFSIQHEPLVRVRVGGLQHWRIVNSTREVHPFHIHQVHFLVYAENGMGSDSPEWLDTVNVPYGGSVDLIMDFTDPLIRGMSLFHCHLPGHEDKGMMAKIQSE